MVIVLVFVAALALVSATGWVVISGVRARKELALKASINELMFGDEKPPVRVIGKRKPLPAADAPPLGARLTAEFDAFLIAWGAFARALKPYEKAQAQENEASARIYGIKWPDDASDDAIAAYLEKMRAEHLTLAHLGIAKAACHAGLNKTSQPFMTAFTKLVNTLTEIRELDKVFVVPDQIFDQTHRAEVVLNSARRHRHIADNHKAEGHPDNPPGDPAPEPKEGWAGCLANLEALQVKLINAKMKTTAALAAAFETGKQVKQRKLEYTEPTKPEASEVDAYLEAITTWYRFQLSEGRAHNEARHEFDRVKLGGYETCHSLRHFSQPHWNAPSEVRAAYTTCVAIKNLVEKWIGEDVERFKKVENATNVYHEVKEAPTGELKSLLAALKSGNRTVAMAVGAKKLACRRRTDLNMVSRKPDLVGVPVSDEASLARTLRLLDEWSRGALKQEEAQQRASVEANKRTKQLEDALRRLQETVEKLYILKPTHQPEELAVVCGVSMKILELVR